jgi:PTH1 family peptidyl-tRNA hydrolase
VSYKAQKQLVFVGLGNPGKKYEMTRHNIGFMVIKEFAKHFNWKLKEETRFGAYVAKGVINQVSVHLLMPTTYMNNSGQAVRSYLDFYQIIPEHAVVVVDDVALPFGDFRLKSMGSSGGHNGLKSIEAHLGSKHYARLRMGIGPESAQEETKLETLADYVLAVFSQKELQMLDTFVEQGVRILERLTSESITRVMNDVNKKISKPPQREPGDKQNERKES